MREAASSCSNPTFESGAWKRLMQGELRIRRLEEFQRKEGRGLLMPGDAESPVEIKIEQGLLGMA